MKPPRETWKEGEVWAPGGFTGVGSLTFWILFFGLHLCNSLVPLSVLVWIWCLPVKSGSATLGGGWERGQEPQRQGLQRVGILCPGSCGLSPPSFVFYMRPWDFADLCNTQKNSPFP